MKEISSEQFEAEVLKGGKVVVDFYSTECPPCEALAPKFDSLAELYGNDIKFVKMYRQGNRELADKLNVKSSPTLLYYDNGKQLDDRQSGGVKRSEIMASLDKLITPDRAKAIKATQKPIISEYDVIILGGGPGGLAAGIYLGQAKINTVLIDPSLPGGQVSTTHEVSNYPGFVKAQNGYMLSHYMAEQTKETGVTFKVAVEVTSVDLDKKEVVIDGIETIRAKKIIISTGSSPNLTGAPGEKELKGRGISYCATCDAKYFDDKEVIVIGGGNSAVEEADFIAKFASKITMVHQFDAFTANKKAIEKLEENPKISTLFSHEPRSFKSEDGKMFVEVEDLKSKTLKTLSADGVFVFIGMKPNTDGLSNKLELDQWGYIKTDEDMHTNLPDIFAVGDVRSKKIRQITTATGDGTIASVIITRELS